MSWEAAFSLAGQHSAPVSLLAFSRNGAPRCSPALPCRSSPCPGRLYAPQASEHGVHRRLCLHPASALSHSRCAQLARVPCASVSPPPAGLYLVSAAADKSLVLWDVNERKCLQKRTLPGAATGLAWHPTSNELAIVTEDGAPPPHACPLSTPFLLVLLYQERLVYFFASQGIRLLQASHQMLADLLLCADPCPCVSPVCALQVSLPYGMAWCPPSSPAPPSTSTRSTASRRAGRRAQPLQQALPPTACRCWREAAAAAGAVPPRAPATITTGTTASSRIPVHASLGVCWFGLATGGQPRQVQLFFFMHLRPSPSQRETQQALLALCCRPQARPSPRPPRRLCRLLLL
jgi:hypothetical protein